MTWDPTLRVFPFAGQVVRLWAWSPAAATQPAPTQIELTYGTTTLVQVFGSVDGGITYFTIPMNVQTTRAEGVVQVGPGETLLDYVAASETSPPIVIGHTTSEVTSYDPTFGNVLAQDQHTDGVDLFESTTRTVSNDPATWLIAEVTSETACSSALSASKCRTTQSNFNTYGEVTSGTVGDPSDPGTQLSLTYERDAWGNVSGTAADDQFGHDRHVCITYEPTGIFPFAAANTLGHTVYTAYDPGLGVMTAARDPNGLLTRWEHDGFGRITERIRPDGTWTTSSLERTKDGGPQGTWWALDVTTTEDAGPTSTTRFDGAGRPVHTTAEVARREELRDVAVHVDADAGEGHRVRSLRPRHPGGAAVDAGRRAARSVCRYVRLRRGRARDQAHRSVGACHHVSVRPQHHLGDGLARRLPGSRRRARAHRHDRRQDDGGTTATTYGPFSLPAQVTRFGTETTTTTRDAYGRVIKEVDPDRGETDTTYDGFGEALTMSDALGRTYAFKYDGIGRLVERDDTVPPRRASPPRGRMTRRRTASGFWRR